MKAKLQKIQLQSATEARSSTGQPVNTWTTYATVMASIKDLRGTAYYAAQQTANEVVMEVYIWYRSGIEANHRAIVNGDTYEVVGPPVNLDLRNREIMLRLRHVV